MKKYGKEILNGASSSGRDPPVVVPRRPAARAALACLQYSQELGMIERRQWPWCAVDGAYRVPVVTKRRIDVRDEEKELNSLITDEFPLRDTQKLRYEMLDALSDADLAYALPGDNPTLGDLLREMGWIEHCYIESFRTLKMDWSCSGAPELAATVAGIRTWYGSLDDDFEAVIHGYSEADLKNRTIDRGHWSPSAMVQFHIFREAVFMFLAKASVYLKAMRKHLSDEWRAAIG